MAAAPASFPNKETARKAPSPHTAKTFTESWASTKPISSKSASRFCVRSEKHKTEQEKSRPCQALSLTGAASDISLSSCFSPIPQSRPRSAARHSERFPWVFRCRCTRSSSQSNPHSIPWRWFWRNPAVRRSAPPPDIAAEVLTSDKMPVVIPYRKTASHK